jgi:hypothetical protein
MNGVCREEVPISGAAGGGRTAARGRLDDGDLPEPSRSQAGHGQDADGASAEHADWLLRRCAREPDRPDGDRERLD